MKKNVFVTSFVVIVHILLFTDERRRKLNNYRNVRPPTNHRISNVDCVQVPLNVGYHNFHLAEATFKQICKMHKIPHSMLKDFAILATTCVHDDTYACRAMQWMNSFLQRAPSGEDKYQPCLPPARWKQNNKWAPSLGTSSGYHLLHKAYHMFDGMVAPTNPHLYMDRSWPPTQKKHVADKFEKDYKKYLQHMKMYCQSREIVVHLRAMMNIVHFGSFVDEGTKSKRRERVMHRSALLESLNECDRQVKTKSSLITEYSCNSQGRMRFFVMGPPWRNTSAVIV